MKSKATPAAPRRKTVTAPVRRRPPPASDETRASAAHPDRHAATALLVLELFRLIFRSAKKHFQWVQERTGVSGAQLWALAELQRNPGMRVTELARALAVHQTTASNLIERLVCDKLITRERSDLDQRVVRLKLTRKGNNVLSRAPLPLEGVLPDALANLSIAELEDLHARLERLARLMKVRDAAGRRVPLADM